VLTDFGSCHFQGAARITRQSLPPLTPAYLSPQAGLFYLRCAQQPDSYYPPAPEDDLYALGVTAYRLVMGQYPPPLDAQPEEQGTWRVTRPDPRPLLESTPRVEPRLREVIVRLLSEAPEARGTATQVAEALEAVAGETQKTPAPLERPESRGRIRAWKPGLALAAAGACTVFLWSSQQVPPPPGAASVSTPGASDAQAPDAGTAAVGDTARTEPLATTTPSEEEKKPLAQESLPEPRPEQARPDEKGRCPGRKQVPINGGCWVENPSMDAQACAESGYVLINGRCYTHALALPRKTPPNSSPVEAR
jgi:hypothetical protein